MNILSLIFISSLAPPPKLQLIAGADLWETFNHAQITNENYKVECLRLLITPKTKPRPNDNFEDIHFE